MLEAGAGQAEITPSVGTPLSGFISRENKPSNGIDTPLYVRALALRNQGQIYLLLSYDLLGIDSKLEEKILAALELEPGQLFSRERCVLVAVHNHSGPPVGILFGEAGPDPQYLISVTTQSVLAANKAIAALQPARLFTTERRLPGLTYNRRALLTDGRVSIAPVPDLPVVRRGPLDDRLTILLFRNLGGSNLAALVHFACHGVAVLSQRIGGDIPGKLAAEIGYQLKVPCLFLQSAAGDVNPTIVTGSSIDLHDWMETALKYLFDLNASMYEISENPFETVSTSLALEYAPLPPLADIERQVKGLTQITDGNICSSEAQAALRVFRNTMNLSPEASIDLDKSQFVARILLKHAEHVLKTARTKNLASALPLQIRIWRIGSIVLVFLAAEIFSSTGLKIRGLSKRLSILPVSYLASLVGYLPDQEALSSGGYEVDDAWRFYGLPAPFSPESEERLVARIANILRQLTQKIEDNS